VALHKALFLDRDGVINEEVNYLYRREDVRWVEGIVPLCLTAQSLGYKLVVVTNQAGIARGYYSEQQFQELMAWMGAELARDGVTLDAVYFSPYHPEGIGEYKRDHPDRKPNPGMMLRAARELDLDIAAAKAAGLRQAFLIAGTERSSCPGNSIAVNSLVEVQQWLTINASKK
jgi:D-glycero-D-manno-heptose 1,7-bisphosphate phosphatase